LKSLILRLDNKLFADLRKAAFYKEITRTDLLRDALKYYLVCKQLPRPYKWDEKKGAK
jgi:hypothetical protein